MKGNAMPLIKSTSKKAFAQNVKTEMAAGRSQKQAVAIAYATQRAKRKVYDTGASGAHSGVRKR